MTHLRQLRMLAIALGLVAANGCKPETARKSDKAAENVVEKRQNLDDKMEKKTTADSKRIDEKAQDLTKASAQFEARKDVRIAGLRAEHDVIAAQPDLIMSLSQTFPLTDAGRSAVGERVKAFKDQLDDVGNRINELGSTGADEWKQRDDAMTDAVTKLENARNAAWKALEDAPRTSASS